VTPANDTLHKGAETQPPSSVVIYQGPVSMWIAWKSFTVAALLEVAALGAVIYSTTAGSGTALQTPLLIGGVALFAASGIMLAYVIINVKTMRYKITNKLIERESGILVKRIDALDLGRVKDVQLAQTVVDRMVNIGTIEVFSSDRTDPVMLVEAIPGARAVYEKLRDSVIEISQRRGVVPMS
jgi:uncharacterized membrane protein YdbT with pleckstrin-like domain